jgi:hypothetical protein
MDRYSHNSKISVSTKIRAVGAELFRTDVQTWRSWWSLFAVLRPRLNACCVLRFLYKVVSGVSTKKHVCELGSLCSEIQHCLKTHCVKWLWFAVHCPVCLSVRSAQPVVLFWDYFSVTHIITVTDYFRRILSLYWVRDIFTVFYLVKYIYVRKESVFGYVCKSITVKTD